MEGQRLTVVLFEHLLRRFSLEELRTLCFRVGIEYDSVKGEGKAAKARELILYMKRREQLLDLSREIQQMRPDIRIPAASNSVETEAPSPSPPDRTTDEFSHTAQAVAHEVARLLEPVTASDLPNAKVERSKEIYELILLFCEDQNSDYLSQTFKHFEEDPEKRLSVFRAVLSESLQESPIFLQAFVKLLKKRNGDEDSRTVFKTDVSGGEVGQVINVDRLEGGLNINRGK